LGVGEGESVPSAIDEDEGRVADQGGQFNRPRWADDAVVTAMEDEGGREGLSGLQVARIEQAQVLAQEVLVEASTIPKGRGALTVAVKIVQQTFGVALDAGEHGPQVAMSETAIACALPVEVGKAADDHQGLGLFDPLRWEKVEPQGVTDHHRCWLAGEIA